MKILDGLVEQLVGKFGETPVVSFDLKEIVRMLLRESANDLGDAVRGQTRGGLFQLPQGTLAYLLIPFVDDEGRGSARVTIAREGEDYRLHFDVMTDALGVVESTVLRTAAGVSVEMLMASAEDVVAFLRERVHELALSLERMGVTTIDVAYRKPRSPQRMNVDVLV